MNMMRFAQKGIIVGSLFAFVAGFAGAAFAVDTAKLVEYYRRKANVPPNAAVTVEDLKDSPIAGAKQGNLVVGGRKVGFISSADGRYAVFGELEDLTVDPFKSVMEKISLEGRPFKGSKEAKVTIVEYSDFQCPFCVRGYTTIEDQVLKEYGDKVRFVYKHFPLGFHKWAEPAGVATECAADLNHDAYWKLYSYYFENQKQITPENLKEKSKEALSGTGIDMAKWEACLDSNGTVERVRADMAEGQSVGVTGTPGFIINGRLVSGAQPFQRFKAIIDDELSRTN
jgi:protein-disulfide isomerase